MYNAPKAVRKRRKEVKISQEQIIKFLKSHQGQEFSAYQVTLGTPFNQPTVYRELRKLRNQITKGTETEVKCKRKEISSNYCWVYFIEK